MEQWIAIGNQIGIGVLFHGHGDDFAGDENTVVNSNKLYQVVATSEVFPLSLL